MSQINNNYKLLALDLDGTILNDSQQIESETVKIIDKIRGQGIEVIVATGRMYISALPYLKKLNLDGAVITYNGALIKNISTGRILKHHPVSYELAEEIIDFCQEHNLHLNLYFDDRLYYSQKSKEAKYYEKISGVKGNLCENMQEFLDKSPTKLLIVEKNEAKLQESLHILNKKYHDSLKIARSEKSYIDIMDKNVSKGNALGELADELGIKKEEIIAVGDNFNDFEMLNFAGLSLVMDNADRRLKNMADIVVGNNNELGAARGLENILKLN